MTTENLVYLLKKKNYVIYGAGYVALMVYKALKSRGLLEKFQGFITTKGASERIDGYEVNSVSSVSLEDAIIVLAVHESIKNEIQFILNKYNYDKCIWIYPYLFELLLGKPKTKTVSTKEIYWANKDNFAMAARYVVLEQYYGKRTDGDDLYIAFMELHCSHETALKRLAQFKELIKSFDENGFMNKPISLLDNYKILDGLHRLVVSLYKGIENIEAYIYPEVMKLEDIHGKGVIIYKDDLNKVECNYASELIKANNSLAERCLLK